MQQSSVEERFVRVVEEARDIIGEHARSCAERGRAAEEAAQGAINRFAEVSGELAQARRELSALEEEREGLPFMAFRASMDGDAEREEALRARYASIAPEHIWD